jgi:hypothetical protein
VQPPGQLEVESGHRLHGENERHQLEQENPQGFDLAVVRQPEPHHRRATRGECQQDEERRVAAQCLVHETLLPVGSQARRTGPRGYAVGQHLPMHRNAMSPTLDIGDHT